ncbi:MAG: toll/interleukin-1 receptor domain-containing protein [Lewinellaceae bacterium]|nr:toll/interleukin-1 receptor domain-containing protein [Lewinellaceae bacterium]
MPHPSIFISYRIDDSLTQAGRLHLSLEKEFGTGTVFYDKNSLKPGMKWPDELEQQVKAAKIVLVLTANKTKWLGVDEEGTRRIDDPEDWVRKEVITALSDSQKLVIPVLFNNAQLPQSLDAPLQPLLRCQAKQIREAHWDDDLLPLLTILRQHLNFEKAPPHGDFGFHAYTCNRDDQFDEFDKFRTSIQPGSLHFFYLYGGEMQAHKSFFHRIAYELEGRFYDAGLKRIQPGHQVELLEFVVEECTDRERLRERFIRNLYTSAGLHPEDYHPLLRQNLLHLLETSDKIRFLKAGDFICAFAHISHWFWNKTLTPDAAQWFIESFCRLESRADKPALLFFFAFDFNEEQNPDVKSTDVIETVRKGKHVRILPELDMVHKRDIGKWLVRYQRFFSAPLRNQTMSAMKPEYAMEELEPILKKLIDDYFNNQEQ